LRALIFLLIVGIAVPTTFWYRAKHAQAAWPPARTGQRPGGWDEN
jgi:hypothetical protein